MTGQSAIPQKLEEAAEFGISVLWKLEGIVTCLCINSSCTISVYTTGNYGPTAFKCVKFASQELKLLRSSESYEED